MTLVSMRGEKIPIQCKMQDGYLKSYVQKIYCDILRKCQDLMNLYAQFSGCHVIKAVHK